MQCSSDLLNSKNTETTRLHSTTVDHRITVFAHFQWRLSESIRKRYIFVCGFVIFSLYFCLRHLLNATHINSFVLAIVRKKTEGDSVFWGERFVTNAFTGNRRFNVLVWEIFGISSDSEGIFFSIMNSIWRHLVAWCS